jgi:hypothetical protein
MINETGAGQVNEQKKDRNGQDRQEIIDRKDRSRTGQ